MSVAYYSLLGLTPQASIAEIKKAYRAKAMQLHPDKNPSPEAQALFIELTEAYEYLLAEKSGRFKQYISPFTQAEQAAHARREAAKQKAREYAQMRYEAFEQSQAGKTINSLNSLLDVFLAIILSAVYFGIGITITYLFSFSGFIISLIFLLATFKHYWAFVKPYLQFDTWWTSLNTLVETLFFRISILSIANLFLIFKIVFNTLFPIWVIPILFLGIPILVYTIVLKHSNQSKRLWIALAIVPIIINGLFALNFYFSSNTVIEEYDFTHGYNQSRRGKVMNTMIYLENNQYDAYLGIRVFASLEELAQSNHVIYQFEDGLLGMRVMKHYAFTYE